MSRSCSHKLALNPGENMLLSCLYIQTESFYVLLRESPPDDILNEPRRKSVSSLDGPPGGHRGRTASRLATPSCLTDAAGGQ